MREGLEHDDIYIMVEDEFNAIAKTFTPHLHHAEYVRLKNIAKNKNIEDILSVVRPVDSITLMRADTKRRRIQEAKASKQKAELDRVGARAASKRPNTTSSDESEDESQAIDEPWIGTTLQGLMNSPSRKQTSLTGLQSVKSYTRAAAGYSKPRGSPEDVRKFDLAPKRRMAQSPTTMQYAASDHEIETSVDDDDLDSSLVRRKTSISNKKGQNQRGYWKDQHGNPSMHNGAPRIVLGSPGLPPPTKRLLDFANSAFPNPCPTQHARRPQSGQVGKGVLPKHSLLDESWPKPTPLQNAASKRLIQRGAGSAKASDERPKGGKQCQ